MEITPIEQFGLILLKRDDKFSLGSVNGGKLRQAIYLIEKNLEKIKSYYDSTVVCCCSIKSPQSAIISEVCKKYGLKCHIITYGTNKPNRNLSIAQDNGAIISSSPSGYTSVIESYAKQVKGFWINMGFASEEVLEATKGQVVNLPTNLEYLVIPVGSAMNFVSIIKGLEESEIRPKQIIGVSVGKDPTKVIQKYLKDSTINFRIVKSPFEYSKELNYHNNFFDPIYEAKAYHYILENLDFINKKTLLWVVGKRNLEYPIRKINYQTIERRQPKTNGTNTKQQLA